MFGSLLGDGSVYSRSKKSAFFQETHSIKQKDYLLWKYANISSILGLKVRTYKQFEKKQKKYYGKISVYSKSLPELLMYRNMFYPNGKKKISSEVLDQINELGLAIWYCDDGNYHIIGKTVRIMTDSFSYNEQKLIKYWFSKRFDINCKIIKRKRGSYYIQFDRKEAEVFLELIKDYVPASMLYKLGHLLKQNSKRINSALERASVTHKRYYKKNRNMILKKQNLYRKQPHNKKRDRIVKQKYYRENKERILKRCREYIKNNKRKIRMQKIEYRRKNKEKIKERANKYYIKNREIILRRQTEYNRQPEIKKRKIEYDKKRYITKRRRYKCAHVGRNGNVQR